MAVVRVSQIGGEQSDEDTSELDLKEGDLRAISEAAEHITGESKLVDSGNTSSSASRLEMDDSGNFLCWRIRKHVTTTHLFSP